MRPAPDKTFGLRSSTDLYLKLLFDIERLKSARFTKPIQYAAFDAAVTASHILDWVLHELGPDAHLRLTGCEKVAERKKGQPNPVGCFIKKNDNHLGGLEYCRQISNSVKHMIVTMGPKMQNMSTGASTKLHWENRELIDFTSYAYIKVDGKKYEVVELFETMAQQWKDFLLAEGLWVEQPPEDDE